jgi:hypothetical protein
MMPPKNNRLDAIGVLHNLSSFDNIQNAVDRRRVIWTNSMAMQPPVLIPDEGMVSCLKEKYILLGRAAVRQCVIRNPSAS